jgi:hypothetical protein
MKLEEQVQALAGEVRELGRLHGELARVELQTGARRLVTTLALLAFGVIVGVLVLAAAGFAVYFWLCNVLPPAGAASLVALGYFLVMLGAWLLGWRLMRGASGLLLPRTRQMLEELLHWRQKPTES